MEIDKAGVAHYALEGVERHESENVNHETHTEAKGNLPELLCQV